MTIWGNLSIATGILSLVVLIGGIAKKWDDLWCYGIVACVFAFSVFLTVAIVQSIDLKKKAIRYEKEREQILFQIDHLTPETDKIKLNEWILSYNDWVNDINSGQETWGIFDWYCGFDMSGHEIIQLV